VVSFLWGFTMIRGETLRIWTAGFIKKMFTAGYNTYECSSFSTTRTSFQIISPAICITYAHFYSAQVVEMCLQCSQLLKNSKCVCVCVCVCVCRRRRKLMLYFEARFVIKCMGVYVFIWIRRSNFHTLSSHTKTFVAQPIYVKNKLQVWA
jgi:hypothetical protein